jgi:hypothetical protein
MRVPVVVTVGHSSDAITGEHHGVELVVSRLELMSDDMSRTPDPGKDPDEGEQRSAKSRTRTRGGATRAAVHRTGLPVGSRALGLEGHGTMVSDESPAKSRAGPSLLGPPEPRVRAAARRRAASDRA